MDTAVVNGVRVPVVKYKGHRVMTLPQISAVHKRSCTYAQSKVITYERHGGELIPDVDYFTIDRHTASSLFGNQYTKSLRIITQSGYNKFMNFEGVDDDAVAAMNKYFEESKKSGDGTIMIKPTSQYLTILNIHGIPVKVYGSYKRPLFSIADIKNAIQSDVDITEVLDSMEDHFKVHVCNRDTGENSMTLTEDGLITLFRMVFTKKNEAASIFKVFMDALKNSKSKSELFKNQSEFVASFEKKYSVTEMLTDPAVLEQVLTELKYLQKKNAKLESDVEEMKPKVEYHDNVLNCQDAISTTSIASEFGKSGSWLNKKLHELGVQYRQNGVWILYDKYANSGYTVLKTMYSKTGDGETHAYNVTYWTQAGRKFIHSLLDK